MTDRSPASSGLTAAMTALAALLEAENQALHKSEFSASGQLAETKREAIARLDDLTGPGQPPAGRTPADRALHQRLDAAVSRNRILLQQAIDTQQRVIATIVRALDPDDAMAPYPMVENAHRPAQPVALTLSA